MKIKINSNIWGSVLMIAFSTVILISIPFQIENIDGNSLTGPRFMPFLSAAVILIIGIFNFVKGCLKRDEKSLLEIDLDEQKRVLKVLVLLAVFYMIAMIWNIVIPAIAAGCILLMIMRCRKRSYYISVLATGIILYLASRYLIHVRF